MSNASSSANSKELILISLGLRGELGISSPYI